MPPKKSKDDDQADVVVAELAVAVVVPTGKCAMCGKDITNDR